MRRPAWVVVLALWSCSSNYGESHHDHWYYQSCYDDSFCNPELTCVFPMCTARCTSSADCADRFDHQSYCAVDGWCRSACTTIADCPDNTASCTNGTCVAQGLGL